MYFFKKGVENYNMKVYKWVCWDGKYMWCKYIILRVGKERFYDKVS